MTRSCSSLTCSSGARAPRPKWPARDAVDGVRDVGTRRGGADINGPPMYKLWQFRLLVEFPPLPGELHLTQRDALPRFATLIGLPLLG